MGVCGATNVTLRSFTSGATVESWSIPAFCITMKSPSVMWATGDDCFCITPRIAKELNIRDGDMVEFVFDSTGDTFRRAVSIKENLSSDVIIHGMHLLDLTNGEFSQSRYGELVTFKSGRQLILPRQNMWAGIRTIQIKGAASLFFDGASRNNPNGPAGYGFRIVEGHDASGRELVEGFGYCGMDRSNNEMEYEGLIDGLIWAMRLDLASLDVYGDSEVVINQMSGEYGANNPKLKRLRDKALGILKVRPDLKVDFVHISRNQNEIADNLANKAIVTKKNATIVNWPNVNSRR